MKRLTIIWHSMTGGSKVLADAAAAGSASADGVETLILHAEDASPQTLLDADGYIFAFPENLAAISGVMKATSAAPTSANCTGRACPNENTTTAAAAAPAKANQM